MIIKSKKPFNSFYGMKESIRQYLISTNYINKELSEEKNKQFFNKLKDCINIDIDIDINYSGNIYIINNSDNFIDLNGWDKNTIFYKNAELLNNFFKETLKEKHINYLKSLNNEDFFSKLKNELDKYSYNSYYSSTLFLVLSSDSSKLDHLSKMKEKKLGNYDFFISKIIQRKKQIKETLLDYFMKEKDLQIFDKWLEDDINKLKFIEDYGKIEEKNREKLLKELKQ